MSHREVNLLPDQSNMDFVPCVPLSREFSRKPPFSCIMKQSQKQPKEVNWYVMTQRRKNKFK